MERSYSRMSTEITELQTCIDKALYIACRYGGVDGAHHKMWVIDQMVRALVGCPEVIKTADFNGHPYTFSCQDETPEYKELIRKWCQSDEGEDDYYYWDIGIAP